MKTRKLLTIVFAAGMILALTGAAQAAIIYGPTDFLIGDAQTANVTTLSSADVSGMDELIIEYTVAPTVPHSDLWVVLEFNNTNFGDPYSFTGSDEGAFLTKEVVATHQTFQTSGGSWAGGDDSSVLVTPIPGSQHAVRITLSGLLSTSGFSGIHDVTFEIAHNAATVATADRTFSGTVDLGTDDGLDIDLIARAETNGHQDVQDLTITIIPEPATMALLAFGACLPLFRRKRW